MPAKLVAGTVAMPSDAVSKFAHLRNELLAGHYIEVVIHLGVPVLVTMPNETKLGGVPPL